MLLSAVTTPVRASVQTGAAPRGGIPANLAREGDLIGLTAEAGGFARPNHGLTTVVTGHGLRYPVEISENSPKSSKFATIRHIKPILTGITIPVFRADVQLILYVFSVTCGWNG